MEDERGATFFFLFHKELFIISFIKGIEKYLLFWGAKLVISRSCCTLATDTSFPVMVIFFILMQTPHACVKVSFVCLIYAIIINVATIKKYVS